MVVAIEKNFQPLTKRRESEKGALDKKDVSRFLNQQNKKDEGTGNSAMAEAFAKFNLK